MAFTYFFRDQHTLDLLVDHVMRSFSSPIRVWDAGCAMGPEPYTLAITFAERMGYFAFKSLTIDATDLDGSNLFADIIANGIYDETELKRIPKAIFDKYFHPTSTPDRWQIDDRIRTRLRFHRHDLLTLQPVGDRYNLVLCKNVLLHLQPQERIQVIRMYHRVLVPGGFFAMEQTQKLPDELTGLFEQVVEDAQLYRRLETS